MPKPQPYRRPRLAGITPDRPAHVITERLAAEYERIASSAMLSERGKLQEFARVAAPGYVQLRGVLDAGRKRAKELERHFEAVTGKAYSVTMDAFQRENTFALAAEARRDPAVKKQLADRLLDERRADPETQELRRFFLALDDLINPLSGAHREVIRRRLDPTMPAAVEDIRRKAAELEREMANTQVALRAITASVPREDFEALGIIGKPMTEWSNEELETYAAKVGPERFLAELGDDAAFTSLPSGELPESHAPDKDSQDAAAKAAAKDAALQHLFEDPAEPEPATT